MLLDEDYLNLFKQVRDTNVTVKNYDYEQIRNNDTQSFSKNEMIRETPDYGKISNFNNPNRNLNEVSRPQYSQNDNLNEFIIEKRFNDEPFENVNEVRRQQKEDKLNEIMMHRQQEQMNEVMRNEAAKKTLEDNLNEVVNFNDVSVVTVEMFEKARFNSMMYVANKILPK